MAAVEARRRLAFIEPWNVGEPEAAVAMALGIPINRSAPDLWRLVFKSAGRRLFAEAGVPVPVGGGGCAVSGQGRRRRGDDPAEEPSGSGGVINHDNSGGGDGNALVGLHDLPGDPVESASRIRERIETLPEWYLQSLRAGSVVEELVAGQDFSSPSVQVDITPYGEVIVLSTHEQVFAANRTQVYTGCRFPAAPAYAAEVARYGAAIGQQLSRRGVAGRFGVDFAAAHNGTGTWTVYALEINLGKGATSHPFTVLRNLIPGRYDPSAGEYRDSGGRAKYYSASDNVVDEAWTGMVPADVIPAVAEAGLAFDPHTRTGVVLHMLSCLAVDGRFGLTAIGNSPEQAWALQEATRMVVDRAASFRRRVPA